MSAKSCGCDYDAVPPYVCENCRNGRWEVEKTVAPSLAKKTLPGRTRVSTLPTDPKERKKYPIVTGVLDYFPDAIAAIAKVSFVGNEQHNPGQPLHWAREKSKDQEDTLGRHLMERGTLDSDGCRHTAKAAWRMLAILQLEIEGDKK